MARQFNTRDPEQREAYQVETAFQELAYGGVFLRDDGGSLITVFDGAEEPELRTITWEAP